ncbi:hypothetical protein CEXT_733721 [Caerostris extrusa]|uniref:Uncharacterized protein n=1 Tax=Caerostris extrusa TaxID=172846 RepID=A0AAV4X474_CAEEX|nr:hypothetical protein CEXT_733721 [Caerostris extrusa]
MGTNFPDSKVEWTNTNCYSSSNNGAHLFVQMSAQKIQLLLKKLLKISEMCSIHSWKTLKKRLSWFTAYFQLCNLRLPGDFYNTDLTKYYHFLVDNSTSIPEDLKYYVNIIRDITYLLTILSMEGFLLSYQSLLLLCMLVCKVIRPEIDSKISSYHCAKRLQQSFANLQRIEQREICYWLLDILLFVVERRLDNTVVSFVNYAAIRTRDTIQFLPVRCHMHYACSPKMPAKMLLLRGKAT